MRIHTMIGALLTVALMLVASIATLATASPGNTFLLEHTITSESSTTTFNISCTDDGSNSTSIHVESTYDGSNGRVYAHILELENEYPSNGEIESAEVWVSGSENITASERIGTAFFNGTLTRDGQVRVFEGQIYHSSALAGQGWTHEARIHATIYTSTPLVDLVTQLDVNLSVSNETLFYSLYAVTNNPEDMQMLAQAMFFLSTFLNATTETGANATFAWYRANGSAAISAVLGLPSLAHETRPGSMAPHPPVSPPVSVPNARLLEPLLEYEDVFNGSLELYYNASISYGGNGLDILVSAAYNGDHIEFDTPYGPMVLGPHNISIDVSDGSCSMVGWAEYGVNPIVSFVAAKQVITAIAEDPDEASIYVELSNGGDENVKFVLDGEYYSTVKFTEENISLAYSLGLEYNGTLISNTGETILYRLSENAPPVPLILGAHIEVDASLAGHATLVIPWINQDGAEVHAVVMFHNGKVVVLADKPMPPTALDISVVQDLTLPPGYTLAGIAVDVNASTSVAGNITLGLSYKPGLDPASLVVLHFHNGSWQVLHAKSVDVENHILYVEAPGFSVFAVTTYSGTPSAQATAATDKPSLENTKSESTENQTATGENGGIDPWLITTIIAIIAIIGVSAFFLRR